MKKRIFAIFLALTLCLSMCLVSCKGNNDSDKLTREDYHAAYTKVAQSLYNVTNLPNSEPTQYIEFSNSSDKNYYAVGAFILFLRNLYMNDSFEITEEAVKLSASYQMYVDGNLSGSSMNVTMRSYRDPESGLLKNDIYQNLDYSGDTMQKAYIGIDIDYDFKTDTLKAFDLKLKVTVGSHVLMLGHYTFDGKTVMILNGFKQDEEYDAVLSIATERESDIASRVENAKVLGDFSAEYTSAMITQARIVYPDHDITSPDL